VTEIKDFPPLEEDIKSNNNNAQITQPITVVAHLLCKISALILYLCGIFLLQFVIVFILVVILVAVDFWITKNVTGRKLVGLRWWNEVKDDGSSEWIFESLQAETSLESMESKIFWISLVVFPVLWFTFLVVQIFSLGWNWAILCFMGFILSAANVTGYIKCARDAKKRVAELATTFVVNNAMSQF